MRQQIDTITVPRQAVARGDVGAKLSAVSHRFKSTVARVALEGSPRRGDIRNHFVTRLVTY
jgi:hypothetical protein